MRIAKAIAAIVSVCAFLYYQHALMNGNVILDEYDLYDEFYFITISLSISAFAFLSIHKDDGALIKSLLVLCSTFFAAIVIVYGYRWVLFGDGSANYYTAVCISAVLTFIYTITYAFIRYRANAKLK